jgi:hypothetical protein
VAAIADRGFSNYARVTAAIIDRGYNRPKI